MATTPQFVATPRVHALVITDAEGTAELSFASTGSNGTKFTALSVVSNNSANTSIFLILRIGSTSYIIGEVFVPASPNENTWQIVNGFDPNNLIWLDRQEPGLPALPGAASLRLRMSSAVAPGRSIHVTIFGGDF